MDWEKILALQAWTPLSEIDMDYCEPIVDSLYKVGPDAYLKTRPYNPRQNGVDNNGPFVTIAYWAPCIASLQRVISSDSTVFIVEAPAEPPAALALGTTGLYMELKNVVHKKDAKVTERGEYSSKGIFLNKVLSLGRFSYYFLSNEDEDERVFLIAIALIK